MRETFLLHLGNIFSLSFLRIQTTTDIIAQPRRDTYRLNIGSHGIVWVKENGSSGLLYSGLARQKERNFLNKT